MGKVIYFVASSLDGYIADPDSKLDRLHEYDSAGEDFGYKAFYETLGAVIMGSRTYMDVVGFNMGWVYPGVESVVMTHRSLPLIEGSNAQFRQGDVKTVVDDLKTRTNKHIWLVGGGDLAAQFLNAGLLDELQLAFMPLLLGGGSPLFPPLDGRHPLTMTAHHIYPGGVITATYLVGKR